MHNFKPGDIVEQDSPEAFKGAVGKVTEIGRYVVRVEYFTPGYSDKVLGWFPYRLKYLPVHQLILE